MPSIYTARTDMSRPAMEKGVMSKERPEDGKFLVVDEAASQGWWLPGGGVDLNEDLATAAVRETLEEAGVEITIKGILRFEYSPSRHGFRVRIIFYAEPKPTSPPPKTIPDYESAGACYVSEDELKQLPLRGHEPEMWFKYVANGGTVHPLSALGRERDLVLT